MTFWNYQRAPGPCAIIYGLTMLFFIQVPCTDRITVMGVHLSNKIYMYLVVAQVGGHAVHIQVDYSLIGGFSWYLLLCLVV